MYKKPTQSMWWPQGSLLTTIHAKAIIGALLLILKECKHLFHQCIRLIIHMHTHITNS